MKEKIEVGDLVDIFFENKDPWRNARVLYIPVASGDCWRFIIDDLFVCYVQNFQYMIMKTEPK